MANRHLIRLAVVLLILLSLSGCAWYGGYAYHDHPYGYGYFGYHDDYPYRHHHYYWR